jgi:hypothetical protein
MNLQALLRDSAFVNRVPLPSLTDNLNQGQT